MSFNFFKRLSQQPICCYLLITKGVLEDNVRNLFIEANGFVKNYMTKKCDVTEALFWLQNLS